MNIHEPKGQITQSDINIVMGFGARMEEICAGLGYNNLEAQAQTVQRIARMALYECNYEARRARVCGHNYQEYPFVVDEEGSEPDDEVVRFMRRSADDDPCERF